jgi:hypothetical protein
VKQAVFDKTVAAAVQGEIDRIRAQYSFAPDALVETAPPQNAPLRRLAVFLLGSAISLAIPTLFPAATRVGLRVTTVHPAMLAAAAGAVALLILAFFGPLVEPLCRLAGRRLTAVAGGILGAGGLIAASQMAGEVRFACALWVAAAGIGLVLHACGSVHGFEPAEESARLRDQMMGLAASIVCGGGASAILAQFYHGEMTIYVAAALVLLASAVAWPRIPSGGQHGQHGDAWLNRDEIAAGLAQWRIALLGIVILLPARALLAVAVVFVLPACLDEVDGAASFFGQELLLVGLAGYCGYALGDLIPASLSVRWACLMLGAAALGASGLVLPNEFGTTMIVVLPVMAALYGFTMAQRPALVTAAMAQGRSIGARRTTLFLQLFEGVAAPLGILLALLAADFLGLAGGAHVLGPVLLGGAALFGLATFATYAAAPENPSVH